MRRFTLHVLILLGALVFSVGLINMSAGNRTTGVALEETEGATVFPTLSSSVRHYQQELVLPKSALGGQTESANVYLELIRDELASGMSPAKVEIAEPEAQMPRVAEKPVEVKKVTTAPKQAEPKKPEKDYVERWALVTAYCPCSKCCGYATPGRTSTGTSAWKPGIAADPRAVAYGTEIYVEGYGRRKVDDTGGAMRRSWRRKGLLHLDIRMTYHYSAVKWGRKMMKVRIYRKK